MFNLDSSYSFFCCCRCCSLIATFSDFLSTLSGGLTVPLRVSSVTLLNHAWLKRFRHGALLLMILKHIFQKSKFKEKANGKPKIKL